MMAAFESEVNGNKLCDAGLDELDVLKAI